MLSLLLPRPRHAALPAASTGLRVEVCPPSLLAAPQPTAGRWWRRLGRPEGSMAERLTAVQQEFVRSLDGVPGQHAAFLQHRLAHCRSLRELWHLRAEVFGVIATELSQHEAHRRIEPLNRHFPTRSPRSGFAPLDA
jgi:hypothetical protein